MFSPFSRIARSLFPFLSRVKTAFFFLLPLISHNPAHNFPVARASRISHNEKQQFGLLEVGIANDTYIAGGHTNWAGCIALSRFTFLCEEL